LLVPSSSSAKAPARIRSASGHAEESSGSFSRLVAQNTPRTAQHRRQQVADARERMDLEQQLRARIRAAQMARAAWAPESPRRRQRIEGGGAVRWDRRAGVGAGAPSPASIAEPAARGTCMGSSACNGHGNADNAGASGRPPSRRRRVGALGDARRGRARTARQRRSRSARSRAASRCGGTSSGRIRCRSWQTRTRHRRPPRRTRAR
jgi:hypothetical protein